MQAPVADVLRAIGNDLFVTKSFIDESRMLSIIKDTSTNVQFASKVWTPARAEGQLFQVSTEPATPQQQGWETAAVIAIAIAAEAVREHKNASHFFNLYTNGNLSMQHAALNRSAGYWQPWAAHLVSRHCHLAAPVIPWRNPTGTD
jgi:hypothetical protein